MWALARSDELQDLRTIRTLRLNYNKFEKFPLVVAQLPRLQSLEISGNGLQALDPVIGNMQGACPQASCGTFGG